MKYFANPVKCAAQFFTSRNDLAQIRTPKQGNALGAGITWCADNGRGPGKAGVIKGGCGKGWVGAAKWLAWLDSYTAEERARCQFVTLPDVVGDAAATAELSYQYARQVRAMGYKVALVLQNGQESVPVRWDEIDAVFVGGDNDFKLGPVAAELCREAKVRGLWVHVGRVNSLKRMRYSAAIEADSCDGTYVTFGPVKNLPNLLSWLDLLNHGIKIPPVKLRAATYGLAPAPAFSTPILPFATA